MMRSCVPFYGSADGLSGCGFELGDLEPRGLRVRRLAVLRLEALQPLERFGRLVERLVAARRCEQELARRVALELADQLVEVLGRLGVLAVALECVREAAASRILQQPLRGLFDVAA